MRRRHKASSSRAQSQRTNFSFIVPITTVNNSLVSNHFASFFSRTTIVSQCRTVSVVLIGQRLIVVVSPCIMIMDSIFWILFWFLLIKIVCCCYRNGRFCFQRIFSSPRPLSGTRRRFVCRLCEICLAVTTISHHFLCPSFHHFSL
jgi:hypothetical protein